MCDPRLEIVCRAKLEKQKIIPGLLEAFRIPRSFASGMNESIVEEQAEACSLLTKLLWRRYRNTPQFTAGMRRATNFIEG